MDTRKNYRSREVKILHILSGDVLIMSTSARNKKVIMADACYSYWVAHHRCCNRKCKECCWARENKNPIAEYDFTWL